MRRLSLVLILSMLLLGFGAVALVAQTPTATPTPLASASATPGTTPSATPAAHPYATPPGLRLVGVEFTSAQELDHLNALYDVWEIHPNEADPTHGWVLMQVSNGDVARLRFEGFTITGVPAALEGASADGFVSCGGGSTIVDFPCYRSVDDTYADLALLATTHPTLATWIDIGDSWEKTTAGGSDGDDLRVLKVTNAETGGDKFRFALMAAIHPRELATAETATRFAEMLVNGYGRDPDITWLLDHGEAYILAMANPDGRRMAEQGYCWRKNTNRDAQCSIGFSSGPGIDLNRNFAFKWDQCTSSGCSSGNACALTFRGVSAASEPETVAIQEFLLSLFPDVRGPLDTDVAPSDTPGLFISLHSYAPIVLYPWGWTSDLSPNAGQLQNLGDKFGYITGYPVCMIGTPGCLYQADGTTDDWLYGERGIASLTIEMGNAFFQACQTYETDMVDDLLATLLYAFKAARQPYLIPAGPEPINVTVSSAIVVQGTPITLTATLDTTRHDDHGGRQGVPISATVVLTALWSIDAPAWVTDTVTLPMLPVDGAFDEEIEAVQAIVDSTGLALGKHLLFVEGIDNNGQVGVTSAVCFEVISPPVAPTPTPRGTSQSGCVQIVASEPGPVYLPSILKDRE